MNTRYFDLNVYRSSHTIAVVCRIYKRYGVVRYSRINGWSTLYRAVGKYFDPDNR